MKLKGKLTLLMVSFTVLFALCNWVIQEVFVIPSFLEIERTQARENLRRTTTAISREISILNATNSDWANWDDAYRFAADHNQEFIDSNLVVETYEDNHLNLILIFDLDGNYLAGNTYDPDVEDFFSFADFPLTELPATIAESLQADGGRGTSGLIATSRGPMVFSCQTIHRSDNSGPSRGFLLMGYFLNDPRIEQLGRQVVQDLSILPVADLPPAEEKILAAMDRNADSPYYLEPEKRIMHAYTSFADINGRPILLIKVDLPRNILLYSLRTVRLFLFLSIAAGVIVILLLLLLTQNLIVRPLDLLVSHMVSIRDGGQPPPLEIEKGAEEIAILAREFNSLISQLEEKRREQEAARLGREKLITELQEALANVKTLSGLLPICASCKKIRDDKGYWKQIESYIRDHADVDFSHGICPDCFKNEMEKLD